MKVLPLQARTRDQDLPRPPRPHPPAPPGPGAPSSPPPPRHRAEQPRLARTGGARPHAEHLGREPHATECPAAAGRREPLGGAPADPGRAGGEIDVGAAPDAAAPPRDEGPEPPPAPHPP